MGFVRLLVIGLIGLTVIYLAAAWFLRSTRRERLEREWDLANPEGDKAGRREEVEQGVEAFKSTLGYRALWLIYIVPAVLVIVAYFKTN